MAYNKSNLSVIAYANGFSLWHYTTTDTAADVDTAGYFNDAAGQVRVGDIIVGNVDTDGTPQAGLFRINANDGAIVDVDDMLQIGGTDTD